MGLYPHEKNFFNEHQYVEAYYAIDARKELGLGKNELISLAMLLGGDYTDGVKGVGIVNGMEILQAFPVNDIEKGLSEFRHWLDGFGDDPVLPENDEIETTYLSKRKQFHKKHKSARTRWVAPPDFPSQSIINAYKKPVVDKSDGKFTWAKPNIEGLRQFCAESIGWNEEETERVVLPVLTVLKNKSKQRRLESYFMRYEDGIKFAEVCAILFHLFYHLSRLLTLESHVYRCDQNVFGLYWKTSKMWITKNQMQFKTNLSPRMLPKRRRPVDYA